MTFVFDCSFGHADATPEAVRGAGASGVVLYAGCQDGRKNATRTEVQALLDHGLMVGLVIENGPQDMSQGRGLGIQYATNLYTAAQQLGYDRDGCVLFTAADWDVTTTDVGMVDQFMQGFREVIPVPGLYGDREALDYCAQRGHAVGFWQTNAMSWSGGQTSTHAHMQQRFNDPRAHGLPVDVNDLLRTDLQLMGADPLMSLTDQQAANLVNEVTFIYQRVAGFLNQRWYTVDKDGNHHLCAQGTAGAQPAHALDSEDGNYLVGLINALAAQNSALASQLAAVQAQVKTLQSGGTGGVTAAQVQAAAETGLKAIFAKAAE